MVDDDEGNDPLSVSMYGVAMPPEMPDMRNVAPAYGLPVLERSRGRGVAIVALLVLLAAGGALGFLLVRGVL